MTISKEMERSDTLKLPGTESPGILVLPIKISKSKKKRNVKKTLDTQQNMAYSIYLGLFF
jgi:hypothetical protein